MNKMIVFLIISTVIMSSVSGLLFYQLNVVQTENNELKDEVFEVNAQLNEVNTQLEEEQNTSIKLENQINELEYQLSELEYQLSNSKNRVKITDFRLNGTTFPPPVGVGWYSDFIVTVENFGTNDVANLSVVFDVQYRKLGSNEPFKNRSISIGTVKVGEIITVHQWNIHGDINGIYGNASTLYSTLVIDDVIVDKRSLTN